jgi:hypothetical protein
VVVSLSLMAEQPPALQNVGKRAPLETALSFSMSTVAYTSFPGDSLDNHGQPNPTSTFNFSAQGYHSTASGRHAQPYEEDGAGDVSAPNSTSSANVILIDQIQESRNELALVMSAASHINSKILDMCTSANHNTIRMNKEDRSRLQFLKDTILLLLAFIGSLPGSTKEEVDFIFYVKILSKRMMETVKMVNKIANFSAAMTPNFDIFELILRNQYAEMNALFPAQIHPDPTELIVDEKARASWRVHFQTRSFVKFDDFLLMLRVENVFKEEPSVDLVRYLRYFVNFPNEDAVTPYKWNWLLNLFGPLDSFSVNFSNIVTKRGFLGLINRIQAFEILTMVHQPRCYLIRLSRTEPQFLAFSYRNSEGHIGHQINKDQSGRPIPVEQFIRDKFPKYEPVQKSMNLDLIFEIDSQKSLVEYASYPSGYIV